MLSQRVTGTAKERIPERNPCTRHLSNLADIIQGKTRLEPSFSVNPVEIRGFYSLEA